MLAQQIAANLSTQGLMQTFLVPILTSFTFIKVLKGIQIDIYALINSVTISRKNTNAKYKKCVENTEKLIKEYQKLEDYIF